MGYKNSLLLVMAGMLLSCSSNIDELSGKKFEGYYETCERITIDFDSDSKVTGQISSTDLDFRTLFFTVRPRKLRLSTLLQTERSSMQFHAWYL